jgi:hypothetical protein
VEIKVEKSPQGVLNPKAKRFMEGRIDSLLIECGFSKMPDDFLKAAKEEHGKNGLDVHVPSKEEVPCQMYYREQYEKPGVPAYSTCIRVLHQRLGMEEKHSMKSRYNLHMEGDCTCVHAT